MEKNILADYLVGNLIKFNPTVNGYVEIGDVMIQWFVALVPTNKKTIIQYPKPFKKYAYPLAICYDYPDSNNIAVGAIAPCDNTSCFAISTLHENISYRDLKN